MSVSWGSSSEGSALRTDWRGIARSHLDDEHKDGEAGELAWKTASRRDIRYRSDDVERLVGPTV